MIFRDHFKFPLIIVMTPAPVVNLFSPAGAQRRAIALRQKCVPAALLRAGLFMRYNKNAVYKYDRYKSICIYILKGTRHEL